MQNLKRPGESLVEFVCKYLEQLVDFDLPHLLKLHVISIVSEVPCKRAVTIFVLQG